MQAASGLTFARAQCRAVAMKKHITLLALVALAACNKEDHTIVAGPDYDNEVNQEAEANIVLPPSIAASKTYRCADNTIVTVDWLSDGKSANVRAGKAENPVMVSAAEAGQPMTSDGGYSVTGSKDAGSVKIAVPGKSAQTCNA
jgi:hypothetical protein